MIKHFLPDLYKIAAKNQRFFAAILYKSGKKCFIILYENLELLIN
jgi:hypothetical protein